MLCPLRSCAKVKAVQKGENGMTDNEKGDSTPYEENHVSVPYWLVFVYLTLITWSVWNLIRYWD